jgi:lysophospholipase L1-like esterase
MSIKLIARYPFKVDPANADYPTGVPRNVTADGAGDGTPWEELIIKEFIGFRDAALLRAGVTANDLTETAQRSQILDALRDYITSEAAEVVDAAADRAETAAEVAMTAGYVYADVASGEAARADGEYFWVVSADASEVLELWLMGATTATDTGKRTFSKEMLDVDFASLVFVPGGISSASGEDTLNNIRVKTGFLRANSLDIEVISAQDIAAFFYDEDKNFISYSGYGDAIKFFGNEGFVRLSVRYPDNSPIAPQDVSLVKAEIDYPSQNINALGLKNEPNGLAGIDSQEKLDRYAVTDNVIPAGSSIESKAWYDQKTFIEFEIWDRDEDETFYLNTLYTYYPVGSDFAASLGFKRVSDDRHICPDLAPTTIPSNYAFWLVTEPPSGVVTYYLYVDGDNSNPPVGKATINWDLVGEVSGDRFIGTDGQTPAIPSGDPVQKTKFARLNDIEDKYVPYEPVFDETAAYKDWSGYQDGQIISLEIWDREDSDEFYLNTFYRYFYLTSIDTYAASIGFKRVSDNRHIAPDLSPEDNPSLYAFWEVTEAPSGVEKYYLYLDGDGGTPAIGMVIVDWDKVPASQNRFIGTDGLSPVITENLGKTIQKTKLLREGEAEQNYWFGKKVVGLGDSITYGFVPRNDPDYPGQLQSWLPLIANDLGMSFVNYGISGSTLGDNGTGANSPFTQRYQSMDNDADLIVVMGGTNDFRKSVPIGTMSDRTDLTFYGALHVLCEGLIDKYYIQQGLEVGKQKQIVFMTPIKIQDQGTGGLDTAIEPFVEAIKEVCAYYAIPVFDSYNLSGITPHILQTVTGTEPGYTGNYNPYITDGTHPNQEGHDMWSKKIAGFFASLAK